MHDHNNYYAVEHLINYGTTVLSVAISKAVTFAGFHHEEC